MDMRIVKLISILLFVFIFCGSAAGVDFNSSDYAPGISFDTSQSVTYYSVMGDVDDVNTKSINAKNMGANNISGVGIDTSNGERVNMTSGSVPSINVWYNESRNGHDQIYNMSQIPAKEFINESFTIYLNFTNIGNATGYQPIIHMIIPDGMDINSISYLGNNIKLSNLGIFSIENNYTIYDPFTRTNITYDPLNESFVENSTFFVAHIPLGSFTIDGPDACLAINAFLDEDVELGKLMDMQFIPIFRFGDSYEDNPEHFPPTYGETITAYVNPQVVRVWKNNTAPNDERSTGPNFKYDYIIDVDIANGITINNITINDTLPTQLYYVNGSLKVYDHYGNDISDLCIITTPSQEETGGIFIINFENYTGTLSHSDIKLRYSVWAPRYDNSTGEDIFIINPSSGEVVITNNTVNVTCNFKEYNLSDSDSNPVYLKALAIQKDVYKNGTFIEEGYVNIGDNLTYVINFQISDYFSFDNFTLHDYINIYELGSARGQLFVNDSVYFMFQGIEYHLSSEYYKIENHVHNIAIGESSDIWCIDIFVSKFLKDYGLADNLTGSLNVTDNLGPAIEGRFRYNVIVNSFFVENQTSVSSLDVLRNNVEGICNLTLNNHEIIDRSSTWVLVTQPSISKYVYAINNDTSINTYGSSFEDKIKVCPGDNVTFLFDVNFPNSVDKFNITDFFPSPIFDVSGFVIEESIVGKIPEFNHWAYTDDSDIPCDMNGTIISPNITVNSKNNWVLFNYGDIYSENPINLKILVTVQVSYAQFADELYLNNIISTAYLDSINKSYTNYTVTGFVLYEPELSINKTVEIIEKDIGGNIQGNTVADYKVVVVNNGHYDAFDVIVCDDFKELTVGEVVAISFVYGNGTFVNLSQDEINDFFNTSKGYNAGILPYMKEGSNASNNFTIIYRVVFNQNAIPNSTIVNTANITFFSSKVNGTNYATNHNKYSDSANVSAANLYFNKNFIGSADYNSTFGNIITEDNRKHNLTIGEAGIFNLTIELPNLNVTDLIVEDTIGSGLKFIKHEVFYDGVVLDGNLTLTNLSNSHLFLEFNGILNPDTNADKHFVTIQLYYVVVNSDEFKEVHYIRNNYANISWLDNSNSEDSIIYSINDSDSVAIYQTKLVISKKFNNTFVEGDDKLSFEITINNIGEVPLFNATVSDDLSDLFNKFISGGKDNLTIVVLQGNETGNVDLHWDGNVACFDFKEFGVNKKTVISFNFTVKHDIIVGDNYTNVANFTGYSNIDNIYNETKYYVLNAKDTLFTLNLTINKSVTNSSINHSNVDIVTIGENITYDITVNKVIGKYDLLNIIDTLPLGFEYINNSVEIFCGNSKLNQTGMYEVVTRNNVITITFTNDFAQYVIDNGGIFIVRFNVTVLNVTSNSATNNTKTNFVELNWNNGYKVNASANVTIVEPNVNIIKKFNVTTNISGNDNVYFNLTVTNLGNSSLFNTTIVDNLTKFVNEFANKSTIKVYYANGTEVLDGIYYWDGNILKIYVGELATHTSQSFKVYFKVRDDVYVGSKHTNVANIFGYAVPICGNDDYNRIYRANSSDSVSTMKLTITKSVNSSSINNGKNNVTIGENVTYNISVSVVTGNYSDLNITDTLPKNFIYVNDSVVIYCNGSKVINSRDYYNVTSTGTKIVIRFSNEFAQYIIKNGGKFSLLLNATRLNMATSAGTINTAELKWNLNNSAKSTVRIVNVEPNVTVSKKFNVTEDVVGGQDLSFNITIKNMGKSPLFNTTIYDNISLFLSKFAYTDSVHIIDKFGQDVEYHITNDILSIYAGELAAGESLSFKVLFKVKEDVYVGSEYTNVANVTGYSVPINDLGSEYNKLYVAKANDTFTTKNLPIVKTVINTTIDNGLFNITIGENITYNITVSVVTGNYSALNITDTLPQGFKYVDNSIVIYNNGVPVTPSSNLYNISVSANGQIVIIFSNDFAQDVIANGGLFTVCLNATVLNESYINKTSDNKTNLAELRWNDGGYAKDTADCTVVEPSVNVTKKFNQTSNVYGGDDISFVVNATNNGSSPLFNVTIVDDLFGLISGYVIDGDYQNIVISYANGSVVPEGVISWNDDYTVVTFNVSQLAINESVAFKLSFVVKDTVVIGSQYTNVVNVTASSVPVNDVAYRNYSAIASHKFVTAKPSVSKDVNGSSVDQGNNSLVTVGENVVYVLNVTVPAGLYENLSVVDSLPAGFGFVGAHLANGSVVVPVAGSSATFEFINYVSNGDNLVIYLTAVVLNGSSIKNNTLWSNGVRLYSNGTFMNNDSVVVKVVEPSVVIDKSINQDSGIKAGDNVSYTVTVRNNGSSILFNTTVIDNLTGLISGYVIDGDYNNVAISYANGSEVPFDIVSWNDGVLSLVVGELANGSSVSFEISFIVKSDVVIGGNYTNVVNVTGSSVPINDVAYRHYLDDDNVTFTTAKPNISKDVNSSSISENGVTNIAIGETITYTINITLPAGLYRNLTVVDSLPAGFGFVGAHLANGSVVVPVAGSSATFEFINYVSNGDNLVIYLTTMALNSTDNNKDDVKINNVALYSNGANLCNASANVTIVEPAIGISKEVTNNTSKFNVTETVQYKIVIENTGNSPAFIINIDDVLDSALVFNHVINIPVGWNYTYNQDTGLLRISGNHLAVGEKVTFTFDCGFSEIAKNITNLANVTISSVNTTNHSRTYSNNSKTDIYVVAADVQINKTCTSDVVAGQNITYDVIVKNNGPDTAFHVKVQELFNSSYLSNVSYKIGGGNWVSVQSGDLISLGDLAKDDIIVIKVRGFLNSYALGILNNTVKVSTDTNETNYTNNNDTNLTTIITKTEIDVLKVSNETEIVAGNNISYDVTVTIKGPSDARNVTLKDCFDTNLLLNMEYSLDKINWAIYTNNTIINLGNITVGNSKTLYFRANVNASTHEEHINNTVIINTTTPYNGTNISTNITSVVINCDIGITKNANVTDVNPGDLISYEINVTSYGISNSTNVTLFDALNNTYLDVSNAVYYVDGVNKGIWNGSVYLGTMAPGQVITVVIKNIKVKDVVEYNVNNVIPNVANVTSYNVPNGKIDNVDVYVNLVDVAVEKNMTHGNYGENITFTITVTNNGPNATSNVTVKDLIVTPDLIYRNHTVSSGTVYDSTTGIWTIGDIAVGQVYYLNITCTINKTGYIYNNVTVETYTGHDTNMSDNNKSIGDVISPAIDLVVDKSVVAYGNYTENITYVVVMTNNGPDDASGVVVVDQLPEGIVFVSANATGVVDNGDGSFSWAVGDLACGSSVSVAVICLINTTGNVTNVVNVSGNEFEWNWSSNYDNVTVEIIPAVDLEVNKTANINKVTVGDKVIYTIVVVNHGPDTAPNTYIVDKLPEGLNLVSYKVSIGSYDSVSGKWTIGDLPVDEPATLVITAIATKPGAIDNIVEVFSDGFDLNVSNNIANFTIDVEDIPPVIDNDTVDNINTNSNLISMQKTGSPLFVLVIILLLMIVGVAGVRLRK